MRSLHRHPLLALHVLLPAAVVVGCITRSADTGRQGYTGSSGAATSSSSGGGEGGGGGQGGEGGGGGGGCVGMVGTGQTAADCDALAISPTQGAPLCGAAMDQEPPGYQACKSAFAVFIPGAAEHFKACLAQIAQASACDITEAQACLDATIAATCDDQAVTDACAGLQTSCGDVIDQAQCTTELGPFTSGSLTYMADCVTNSAAATCQEKYDGCYQMTQPLKPLLP